MDNADVFGSSTAPLTWHDFLERMRQPSAADFVKGIKSFIVSFLNNAPDPQRDSAAVQDFFGNMEAAFRAHPLFAGCSEEELESAGEGLEKYVMTKLFTRVFASLPDDVKVDDQLHEKMALIQQFVQPENLDIKPTYQNEASWLLAQKELLKINMYKAPRDKLVCILNCCKVISNLLLNASLASKEDPPGADDFLPVLIYVTIKANPPQLHSNLLYIERYRRQTRLVAEAAYFFTNMLSAESFILNIDANALSMDELEFQKNMESAQALLTGLSADSDGMPRKSDQTVEQAYRTDPAGPKQEALYGKKHQGSTMLSTLSFESMRSELSSESLETKSRKEDLSISKTLSISDLENKGAIMFMKQEDVGQVFRDFPFLFSQAGDLTVGDVESLLNNYKQLVFRYVCLSKGLGIEAIPPPLPTSQSQSQNPPQALEDLEDTRIALSNEAHEDISETDNGLNIGSLTGDKISESKLPLDAMMDVHNDINESDTHLNKDSLIGDKNSESKFPQEGGYHIAR